MSDGNEVDFVWQHQYHSRWSTYSTEELQVLNKAFKKGQKTVTLPHKDPKKHVIVHFDKMYQLNIASNFEQKIRCLVYSDSFYSWLWKNDLEEWSSYTPDVVLKLELAHQKGEQMVEFSERRSYQVNLDVMEQMNVKTNYTRAVLRERVYIENVSKALLRNIADNGLEKLINNNSLSETMDL